MFEKQSKIESGEARASDAQLNALLHTWKSVELQDGFEATVWRRIRAAAAPEPRRNSVLAVLGDWFMPPRAWANAMATAAGIVIGIGLFLFNSAVANDGQANGPLSAQTLAGSYLTMMTGGSR